MYLYNINYVSGLVFAGGPRFREQRRWALHTLRDFGLGKNIMEKAILDELLDLRKLIEAQIKTDSKNGIDPSNLFTKQCC